LAAEATGKEAARQAQLTRIASVPMEQAAKYSAALKLAVE
jgi:hypothetical protein